MGVSSDSEPLVSLRDHFDRADEAQTAAREAADKRYEQRFLAQADAITTALNAQKEAITAALTAQKEAVVKAELAAEKRFEAVNEFRAQLADQARTFPSKAEVDQRFIASVDRLTKLESDLTLLRGQALGRGSITGPVWGVVGAVMASVIAAAILMLTRK